MSLPAKQNIYMYMYIYIYYNYQSNTIKYNEQNLHIIIIPCHLDEIVS
jgi:hypothetical protein